MLLGDRIEKALILVGVTKERVEKVLGRDCGCKSRQEMFNNVHYRLNVWASRILKGKTEDAAKYLEEILGEKKV